jgi:release factor glutamine methyltransferase
MKIYEPAEDSYLLSKVLKKQLPKLLKKNPDLKFLEVGGGSGINLQTAKDLGVKNIFSCDLNPTAVSHCKKLGFNSVKSDLFKNIKGKFDIIIFNPPYLPEDKREPKDSRLATTGGKKGSEVINKFLKQAKSHLNKDGKIFLLTSNLTKDINFLDYKKKLLDKEKIFFEELFVCELQISN